jgi:hypothetical protein
MLVAGGRQRPEGDHMAKKRKVAKARRGKVKSAKKTARKPARKTAKRKTVKRAAAKKPARKAAPKAAKRRPRKAKSQSIGARLEHAMSAVLETLTDAERLHTRVAAKGVQELE